MFADGFGTEIDLGSWPVLPVFNMLKEKGELLDKDLYSDFNMGVGFAIALPADQADRAIAIAEQHGEKAYKIGRVVAGEGVTFKGEHDGSLAK
jgi:phosphoribosylformylglycinamidine cyclo-ligase